MRATRFFPNPFSICRLPRYQSFYYSNPHINVYILVHPIPAFSIVSVAWSRHRASFYPLHNPSTTVGLISFSMRPHFLWSHLLSNSSSLIIMLLRTAFFRLFLNLPLREICAFLSLKRTPSHSQSLEQSHLKPFSFSADLLPSPSQSIEYRRLDLPVTAVGLFSCPIKYVAFFLTFWFQQKPVSVDALTFQSPSFRISRHYEHLNYVPFVIYQSLLSQRSRQRNSIVCKLVYFGRTLSPTSCQH